MEQCLPIRFTPATLLALAKGRLHLGIVHLVVRLFSPQQQADRHWCI